MVFCVSVEPNQTKRHKAAKEIYYVEHNIFVHSPLVLLALDQPRTQSPYPIYIIFFSRTLNKMS